MTRIVLTLALALVLAGCGESRAADGDPTVVAAFYPLAYAAERIAAPQTTVRNLTPPGVEPHDFELSGRDVAAVGEAELVLYFGQDFQPALERAVATSSTRAVDLLDGLELRDAGASHEEEHAEEGRDPHVWLDPLLYAQVAERVGAELERETEAGRLVRELHALDAEFRTGLSDCERREVVTSHAAFGYLTDRYGLEQVPITSLSPEAEPAPRELRDVVREVRAHGATTVFFETLVSPRLAETVAREVGAQTAVLNPLEGLTKAEVAAGADYFSVMRQNLETLRRGLGCR